MDALRDGLLGRQPYTRLDRTVCLTPVLSPANVTVRAPVNKYFFPGLECQPNDFALWFSPVRPSQLSQRTSTFHLAFTSSWEHLVIRLEVVHVRSQCFVTPQARQAKEFTRTFDKEVLSIMRKQGGFREEITFALPGEVELMQSACGTAKSSRTRITLPIIPRCCRR